MILSRRRKSCLIDVITVKSNIMCLVPTLYLVIDFSIQSNPEVLDIMEYDNTSRYNGQFCNK